MLRIKGVNKRESIQTLFEQGVVDIMISILDRDNERGYEFMFYETLESLNIIISESDNYPESMFKSIKKLSDSTYMINDIDTMYMRVYVLKMLSNKKQVFLSE